MKRIVALLLSVIMIMTQPMSCALAAFELPANLVTIEEEAFAGNPMISGNVTLPDGTKTVGESAFADTRVASMWLPSATTSVGSHILARTGATYVVVGNAGAELADGALEGVLVVVGAAGSTAQAYAQANGIQFYDAENIVWNGGFAYCKHPATSSMELAFPQNRAVLADVTIPETVEGWPVTAVGANAFANLSNLKTAALPQAAFDAMPENGVCWPENAVFTAYSTGVKPILPEGEATELEMNADSAVLLPGETIKPYMLDLPASSYSYVRHTTDENIVTVDDNGVVTAVAPGRAALTLIATDTSGEGETAPVYYATMQIEVVEPSVSVEIEEETAALKAGQIYYPALTIACPSKQAKLDVSYSSDNNDAVTLFYADGELMVQAKAAGEATITLSATLPATAAYEAITATDSFTVTVTEQEIATNEIALYTYAGYEHALYLTDGLPEGASISWASDSELVSISTPDADRAIVDMNGAAVTDAVRASAAVITVNGEADAVVTATVAYADGSMAAAQIPVHAKPYLSWGKTNDRTDLNPSWYYHSEYKDLMPELKADLWPHHDGSLRITAASTNEVPADTELSSEGQKVIKFHRVSDKAGNQLVKAQAWWPGTADVTYTAELAIPMYNAAAPAAVTSRAFSIVVRPPKFVAKLDHSEYTLNMDDQQRGFGYWINWPTGDAYDLQYEALRSSDESVFTVNPDGRLVAVGAGKAELTYTVHCFGTVSTASATVTVEGGKLALEPAELTIGVGETAILTPVLPEGMDRVDGAEYSFWTNREEILSVSHTGKVTGLNAGTARVTYRTEHEGQNFYAESYVTVVDNGARMTLDKTSVGLYEGESFQLLLDFAEGYDERIKGVAFESSNSGAVSVDEDGNVTAVGYGWAEPAYETITVTVTYDDGVTETAHCYVYGEKAAVLLYNNNYYLLKKGEQQHYGYWPVFAGGYTEADFTVVFESDNEEIVSVDETGVMTAVAPGTANVSISFVKDGRVYARKVSQVLVDTGVPAIGEDDWIKFNLPHFFFFTPLEGEVLQESFGYQVSREELNTYYTPVFSETSDPEDAFTIDEEGNFKVTGKAEAEVRVTLRQFDDLVPVPEDFAGTAKVTVSVPEIAYLVNGEPLSEENPAKVGDTVTVYIEGVPEDIASKFVNWEWDDHYLREIGRDGRSITLLAARPGESEIVIESELDGGAWFRIGESITVTGEEPEYQLGEPALVLAVGETTEVWPAFENWEEGSLTSSKPDVVEVVEDRFPMFRAVGVGSAVLTFTCTLNGETLELPCLVTVVESEWALRSFEPDSVMIVGEGYDPRVDIYFTGRVDPKLTFEFEGEGEIEMDYEEWRFFPQKAGKVSVTVTAEKDGKTDSLTREIIVIDPVVRFATGEYLDLMPGDTRVLTLQNYTGKPIQSVTWSTTHADVAAVEPHENAMLSAVVTAADVQNDTELNTLVTAAITFEDGTTDFASASVSVRAMNEIELYDVWFDKGYMELDITDEKELRPQWRANADVTSISYASSHPEVATVSARGALQLHKPGETVITCTVAIGDVSRDCHVTVRVRGWEATLAPESMNLAVGQSSSFVPHLGEDDVWINNNETRFYSSNESVAMVDHLGKVTAVAPGTATIFYHTSVAGQDVMAHARVTVTGETAMRIQLMGADGEFADADSVSLYPRQTVRLHIAGEGLDKIHWHTENGDIRITEQENNCFDLMVDMRDMSGYGSADSVVFTANLADGTTVSDSLDIEYLQTLASVYDAENLYQLSVGQAMDMHYRISRNDPDMAVNVSFHSSDDNIATVDARGIITAVAPGVCEAHITLTAEDGSYLHSTFAYVYVDTPIPSPADEDAAFGFTSPAYYLSAEHVGLTRETHTHLFDDKDLRRFHELMFESDDESIVEIHDNGYICAHEPGHTTIRAWFRGYEEYVATADVYVGVGNEYAFSFDKPMDEHGRPMRRIGDTLTITLKQENEEGTQLFPPLGDGEGLVPVSHIEYGGSDCLRMLGWEGNTITLLAVDNTDDAWFNLDIRLNDGSWWHNFDFHAVIEEIEDVDAFMNESAVIMSEGETVNVWPEFDYHQLNSCESDHPDVVAVTGEENGHLRLEAKGVGSARITAEYERNNGETIRTAVHVTVVEEYWKFHNLDNIPSVMSVGQVRRLEPSIENSGYWWPAIYGESSNPDVLAVEDSDEGQMLHAKGEGSAVLTVSAWKDHENQSDKVPLNKTVHVTKPVVRFAEEFVWIRLGSERIIPLYINSDKGVSSIKYTSEDEGLIAVEDAVLENGDPAMRAIAVRDNNSTRAFAEVTFEDGSVERAAIELEANDEQIWVNSYTHNDYMELATENWSHLPREDSFEIRWDTNAALDSDPDQPGSDHAFIEWIIDGRMPGDEGYGSGVVELVRYEDPHTMNHPVFRGIGEGSVDVEARLVITDKDGEFLADNQKGNDRYEEYIIDVRQPHLDLWFDQDEYTLTVGTSMYLPVHEDSAYAGNSWATVRSSDDESIACWDTRGNLNAVKPGETYVHESVNIGGKIFTATAHIIVQGVDLSFLRDEFTLAVGESDTLVVREDAFGQELSNRRFYSSNPDIVQVAADGTICGIAPGSAVVYYSVKANPIGHDFSIPALVTVTGEAGDFTLNHTLLSLWPEEKAQLEPIADGEITNVCWFSDDDMVSIDEKGELTVEWCDQDNRYVTITCTADVNGEARSATCVIALKPRNVRIGEHQFGPGRWHRMNEIGDEMHIWEVVYFANPDVKVDIDIVSKNPDVVEWNEQDEKLIAVSEGEATIIYTVSVLDDEGNPTGETYSRSMLVLVGYPPEPEAMNVEEDLFIVRAYDNDREHYFDVKWTPDYSDREIHWYSDDNGIANPDGRETRFYPGRAGRTTMHVVCEEYSFEDSFDVLVVEPHVADAASVGADHGANVYAPGDAIQLVVVDENGNPYPEELIKSVEFYAPDVSDEYIQISESGVLTSNFHYHDGVTIRARVTFADGSENGTTIEATNDRYCIALNADAPYFYLWLDDMHHVREYVGMVGQRSWIAVNSNKWEEGFTVEYAVADEGIITTPDAGGNFQCIGAGETRIIATIVYNGETFIREFPVRVSNREPVNFRIVPNGTALKVGEILHLHIGYDSEITYAPNHHFESLDQSVLRPVCHEDENGWLVLVDDEYVPYNENEHAGMTRYNNEYGQFEAMKPGSAVITCVAYFGDDPNAENACPTYDQAAFTVLPSNPIVYFDQTKLELRPDEQAALSLRIDAMGSDWQPVSVEYTVDDEAIAKVMDGTSTLSGARVIGLSAERDTSVTAAVTFALGEGENAETFTATAVCAIDMTSNDDVWVNAHSYTKRMSCDEWSGMTQDVIWQSWTHNASHYDEAGKGSDKARIDWEIDGIALGDEGFGNGIVEFVDWFQIGSGDTAPWNNGPVLRAVAPGEVTLNTHLVLTDKDGNFLAEDWAEIRIIVKGSELNVYMHQDEYHLVVGEDDHLHWHYDSILTTEPDAILFESDNENVVTVDMDGRLYAVNPGEATVSVTVVMGGHSMRDEARVYVEGVDLGLYQNEIHIPQGGTGNIILFMDDHGIGTENPHWFSHDNNIAIVDDSGVVYGVNPGRTVVTFGIDTDYEYQEIHCIVNVVSDEVPVYRIGETDVHLWPEQSTKLNWHYNGEESDIKLVTWTSSDEDMVTVDNDGNVTALCDRNGQDAFVTVTATATLESGETLSASSLVTVHRQNVRIREHQFGEVKFDENGKYVDGAFYLMRAGDWMAVWEEYIARPGTDVRVSVTVTDVSGNSTTVAEWNEAKQRVDGKAKGDAIVTYAVEVYEGDEPTGERYERQLLLRMDCDEQTESLAGRYNPMMVELGDGEAWLDVVSTPYGSYMGELQYYSLNRDVLTFDNPYEGRMRLHNPGRATVHVVCLGDPSMTFDTDVVVIDPERIELHAIDDREDPYLVSPNEEVQLGFFMDGEPFDWYGANPTFEARNYYGDRLILTDDLTVRTLWRNIDWEIHCWYDVVFDGDRRISVCAKIRTDNETPYFYATLGEDHGVTSFTGYPGSDSRIDVMHNLVHEDEELEDYFELSFVSEDEHVVTTDGEEFTLHNVGETDIVVTAVRGEEYYESRFHVTVIQPEKIPNVWIVPKNDSFVAHVGETIQLYASHDGEAHYPPAHWFVSDNQAVLRPVCHEDGNGEYVLIDGVYESFDGDAHQGMTRYSHEYGRFEAISTGSANITLLAEYNGQTLKSTSAFRVINREPKVFLSEPYIELRPDETAVLDVCYQDNGTDWKIQSVRYEPVSYNSNGEEEYIEYEPLNPAENEYAVKVKGLIAGENDAAIAAYVTFERGEGDSYETLELLAETHVNMISNDEVWAHSWITADNLIFFGDENDEITDLHGYNTTTVWTHWNHNASHFDEEGAGSDLAWIEWKINGTPIEQYDGGIVEYIGPDTRAETGEPFPWNNGLLLRAIGAGEVTITSHLRIFDKTAELDENGKPKNFDEAIADCEAQHQIHVREAYMELGVHQSDVRMQVAQDMHPGWWWHEDCTPTTTKIEYLSSDESVVRTYEDGRLFAVAPGHATVTMRHVFENGVTREVSVNVEVVGATAAWAEEGMYALSLTRGQTSPLTPVVNMPEDESICSMTNSYWENVNANVATIEEIDGVWTVVAHNPGTTVISFWQNLEYNYEDHTEGGECFVYSYVTVTDETQLFTLNHTSVTLAGDSTLELEPVYDKEALGEITSIHWETSGDGWAWIEETEDGKAIVRVNQPHRMFHTSVACHVTFENGSSDVADCLITVNPPLVMPNNYQYGRYDDNRWEYMNFGEEMGFWDSYSVMAENVTVEPTFEIIDQRADDGRENPEIIELNPETGYIKALETSGQADILMTLRVLQPNEQGELDYTGETHKRYLHIHVQRDTFPEDVEPTYEVFAVPYQWGRHYLPLTFEPRYSGCELEFYSSDEGIVSFDEGVNIGEMYFHGRSGEVTIDIVCPENEELNTQARVIVFDEEHSDRNPFFLGETSNASALLPGETVQLFVGSHEGFDIFPAVKHVEFFYDGNVCEISDAGELTVRDTLDHLYTWQSVSIKMVLNSGWERHLNYDFRILPVRLDHAHVELRPGQTVRIPLTVDLEGTGFVYESETFEMDNDSVADCTVIMDEDGSRFVELTGKNAYEDTVVRFVITIANKENPDDKIEIGHELFINGVPNEEVWLNAWSNNEYWLSTEEYGYNDVSATVSVDWDTNAVRMSEGGADAIVFEWEIGDENIARFDRDDEGNLLFSDGVWPTIIGVNGGDTCVRVHVYASDTDGNPLNDGNAHSWVEMPVHVRQPHIDITPEQSSYTMHPGYTFFINWNDRSNGLAPYTRWVNVSSDESVVIADANGQVTAIAPNREPVTVTRHCYVYGCDEPIASPSVKITVEGPYITVPETIEIAAGDHLTVDEYFAQVSIDMNGFGSNGDWLETTNGHVLGYNSEERVFTTGQPGKSQIIWNVNISDWNETLRYTTDVIVTGEAAFTLTSTQADLVYGQSIRLEPVFSESLGDLESIRYESYWGKVEVDENGLVTNWNDESIDQQATVYCEAVIGGNTYGATCQITARAAKVRLLENQFDNRRIITMNTGDWHDLCEIYQLTDPDLDVNVSIEIEDESVVILEDNHFKAVGKGETKVWYTLTVSNGEIHKRSATFVVDPDLELHELCADFSTFVVTQDGWGWPNHYFPLSTIPENVPLNVHPTDGPGPRIELEYRSDDKNVVWFDGHSGEMHFGRPGRTMVEAFSDEHGVYTEMEVLVLREGDVRLVTEDNRTELRRGETVQLHADTGIDFWFEDRHIDRIEWHSNYDPNMISLSETGELTIHGNCNPYEGFNVWADVFTLNGNWFHADYNFNVLPDYEMEQIVGVNTMKESVRASLALPTDENGNALRVTGVMQHYIEDNWMADYGIWVDEDGVIQLELTGYQSDGDTYLYVAASLEDGSTVRYKLFIDLYEADNSFHEESVTLFTETERHVDYNNHWVYIHLESIEFFSDNESVAHMDHNGNIFGVAPGEANIYRNFYFAGGIVETSVLHVTVVGATLSWEDNSHYSVTLDLSNDTTDDDSITLVPILNLPEGIGEATNSHWINVDDTVASLDEETGKVKALKPGTTTISYWKDIAYYTENPDQPDCRDCSVFCTITVVDDNAQEFKLNASSLTLAGDSTFQLEPVYDAEALGEPLSISWSVTGHATNVNENGLVSVQPWERTAYGRVICTAEFASGVKTATCQVQVNRPLIKPSDAQYGEGHWDSMGLYEERSFYDFHEVYASDVTVRREFRSADDSIATVDPDGTIRSYGNSGNVFLHMDLYVDRNGEYTGESYSRRLMMHVNTNTIPESIAPIAGEPVIMLNQWGSHWLPLDIQPAYTSCELVYESSDEGILSFDNGRNNDWMFFKGTGTAQVHVYSEEYPHLDTNIEVRVYDENDIYLAPENGETVLIPGETYQLRFQSSNPDMEIWPDSAVDHIDYTYDASAMSVTEDGKLTVLHNVSATDMQVDATVYFKCGNSTEIWRWFRFDTEAQ